MIPITAAALGLGILNEQIDARGIGWIIVAASVVAIVWGILRLARGEEHLLDTATVPGLLLEPEG